MQARTPFTTNADNDALKHRNALPAGTRLNGLEITSVIHASRFNLIYLAHDRCSARHVAVKEYMPSELVMRTSDMSVTVKSPRHLATFMAGLHAFLNEARLLAQFDSPALVNVHRFWENNGTAYLATPYYEGVGLTRAIKEHHIAPTEGWIRMLLSDLSDALETLHRGQCFHRGIAPDKVLLLRDGRPLLLGFGAARRVIGDMTQDTATLLKPGYAAIEQYREIPGWGQEAWTDIYALAALAYQLMDGTAPPPAVMRMTQDSMVPAREMGKRQYSGNLLAALDKGLAVKPEHRFVSIAQMRRALETMDGPAHSSRPASREPYISEPPPQTAVNAVTRNKAPYRTAWLGVSVLLLAGIGTGLYLGARSSLAEIRLPAFSPFFAKSNRSVPAPRAPQKETPALGETLQERQSKPVDRTASYAEVLSDEADRPLPQTDKRAAATANAPAEKTPSRPEPTIAQEPKPKSAKPVASEDETAWNTAKTINEPTAYEAYLAKYPRGLYVAIAKDRLESLKGKRTESVSPATYRQPATEKLPSQPPPQAATTSPPEETLPPPTQTTSSRTLRAADQTMTGDFTPDPGTGVVSGAGQIAWSNGDRFEGTLVRGSKEGKGVFVWNNGQRYSGEWARDLPNGQGTIAFANGSRYTGTVKDGVPHGQGVIQFKSGDSYSGSWSHGQSEGHGRYTWASGNAWEGEFKNDKRTENGAMVEEERPLNHSSSGDARASASEAAVSEDNATAPVPQQ